MTDFLDFLVYSIICAIIIVFPPLGILLMFLADRYL